MDRELSMSFCLWGDYVVHYHDQTKLPQRNPSDESPDRTIVHRRRGGGLSVRFCLEGDYAMHFYSHTKLPPRSSPDESLDKTIVHKRQGVLSMRFCLGGTMGCTYILGHYVTAQLMCILLTGSGPGCPDLHVASVSSRSSSSASTSSSSDIDVIYYYDTAHGGELRANASCRDRGHVFVHAPSLPAGRDAVWAAVTPSGPKDRRSVSTVSALSGASRCRQDA